MDKAQQSDMRYRVLLLLTAFLLGAATPPRAAIAPAPPPGPAPAPAPASRIVAIVNGDAITDRDIDARTRLFVLSTGMPGNPEVLSRLRPQMRRQLIDEKLRLQEILRRKIVVPDKDIAEAIAGIERRNNVQPGTLRHRLEAEGVTMSTLVDEIRVQL